MSEKMWFTDDSTIGRLLQTSLNDKYNNLNVLQRNVICKATIGYSMHLYSFAQMQQQIQKPVGLTAHDLHALRQNIVKTYATALGLKMTILNYLWRRDQGINPKLSKLLQLAGLPEDDELVIRNISSMKFDPKISSQLQYIEELPLLMPERVRENCGNEIHKLTPHIRYKVHQRLRFIASSNQIPMSDLVDELCETATISYYRVTPFRTPLHRKNTIIQNIHNEAEKLSHRYQAQKRRRLHQDGNGGYFNLLQSLSNINNNFDNGLTQDRDDLMFEAVGKGEWNTEINLVDISYSIENFISHGPVGRKHLVDLLMLKSDADFQHWITAKRRLKKIQNMEDLFHKLGKIEYHNMISEYLMVPLTTISYISNEIASLVMN